jgi:hypothetical protein
MAVNGDITVTFSEAVKPPTGVNPADFALSIAYIKKTPIKVCSFYVINGDRRGGCGIVSYSYDTFYEPFPAIVAVSQPGSANAIVIHAAATPTCSQLTNPQGLYLHYSMAPGEVPVEDLGSMPLASVAPDMVGSTTSLSVSGIFPANPVKIDAHEVCPGAF